MAASIRRRKIASACAVALLLCACQEDREIVVRELDGKQIEFSIEGPGQERSGCIWSLTVFEDGGQDRPVWAVGLDENAECRSFVTAPVPPRGYTAEGAPRFVGDRTYVVQAFGPGFNVATTFRPSAL